MAFKGGWGPEDGGGYLVRQSAIVGSGNGGYVFSMLALPRDGSFATGTRMLDPDSRVGRTHVHVGYIQRARRVRLDGPLRLSPLCKCPVGEVGYRFDREAAIPRQADDRGSVTKIAVRPLHHRRLERQQEADAKA